MKAKPDDAGGRSTRAWAQAVAGPLVPWFQSLSRTKGRRIKIRTLRPLDIQRFGLGSPASAHRLSTLRVTQIIVNYKKAKLRLSYLEKD